MTFTSNSVKQLPRGGRQQHRHCKSDIASLPHNNHAAGSQPRHLPHHNVAHQQQTPPRRAAPTTVPNSTTPPQTPPSMDLGSTKKKKRTRRPKDNLPKAVSPDSTVPPVEESIAMPTPKRVISVPSAVTPPSPTTTPGRASVYAGPTFHQSPAPASLPVPKFFSKSVPAPRVPGLQAMLDEEDSKTEGSQTSTSPTPSMNQENHLERLFRADREEKARKKSQSDDSSDNDSTPDSVNPSSFFGMEPDSPFRPSSTQTRPRPQATRTTTEPLFPMDIEKGAGRATAFGQNGKDDKAHEAALRQFLYQSPIAMKPAAPHNVGSFSPLPGPSSARSPSWTPPVNANRNNFSNGSPIPARRLNYDARPAGPTASNNLRTPPPPKPQFKMQRPRHNPFPAQQNPSTPPSQAARVLFHSQPRNVPPPPNVCSKDVVELENSLKRLLKLQPSQDGGVLI